MYTADSRRAVKHSKTRRLVRHIITMALGNAPETKEMQDAITNGDVESVERLAKDADLSARTGPNGGTCLHRIAAEQDLPVADTIAAIVRHGGDVNARDADGRTPLHIVAERVHKYALHNVRTLLEHGANPNAKDEFGNTPVGVCICDEILRLLLENNGDPNASVYLNDGTAKSRVQLTMEFNEWQSMLALLDHGVTITPQMVSYANEMRENAIGQCMHNHERMVPFLCAPAQRTAENDKRTESHNTRPRWEGRLRSAIRKKRPRGR